MEPKSELVKEPKAGVPSVEARLLADYLRKNTDREVSYADLSAVIGADVQAKGRTYLLTARRIVLRESGIVFRPLRNIGLMRLTHAEVAKLEDREQHIRRTAKTNLMERKTVDFSAIPEDARLSCIAKITLATLTVHVHSSKQMKALEGAIPKNKELDLSQTLEAFRKLSE